MAQSYGGIGDGRSRVFNCGVTVSHDDVMALREFLESANASNENLLHQLLERHPALIGSLGFVEFVSEFPLYKFDSQNAPQMTDSRRRDRADLIAAQASPLRPSYRWANIVELKAAESKIADRDVGFRRSIQASKAVQQLQEYREWLTRIPENKALLKEFNWDVRCPGLFLIMGRDQEFNGNPGQLEEIRERLLSEGVRLSTVDDVLRAAINYADRRIIMESFIDHRWIHTDGEASASLTIIVGSVDPVQITPETLLSLSSRQFNELLEARGDMMTNEQLATLESFLWYHTHPEDRSFANHIAEDLAYNGGEFIRREDSWKAVNLLRRRGLNVKWYVGRY